MSERVPTITPWLLRGFKKYARRYMRKHFHSLRIAKSMRPSIDQDTPIVGFANHPSWWDPLTAVVAADALFPDHAFYAPIDAQMLEKYKVFKKLGFFGVEPGEAVGGLRFIRTSLAILEKPRTSVWVTAEGRFSDPRERPIRLAPGLAHLARRMKQGVLQPVAMEYVYWTERLPEILIGFGRPVDPRDYPHDNADAWHARLETSLAQTMDQLAMLAQARESAAFEPILEGRFGAGGVFDMCRRLRAWTTGRKYDAHHMPQGNTG